MLEADLITAWKFSKCRSPTSDTFQKLRGLVLKEPLHLAGREAAALLQAAASDENLAEVIDFLQSEYDVVLNKEDDEGDGTTTKPKSSWSKLKGFFKTKKSKKMKK